MAWVDIGERAALIEGSATRGWAHFQYNNTSGTTTRPCRIVIEPRSGYTFNVNFDRITITGVSGSSSVHGVTQNYTGADSQHPAVWTGNVPAGRNVTATWTNPWHVGSKSPSVTGYLPSGGSAPTGGYATFGSCTWNSITFTSGVSSWGGIAGNIHAAVLTGETNGDADSFTSFDHARREFFYDGTSNLSHVFNATDSSTSATHGGTPLSIKGLLHYKLGYYNYNSMGSTSGIDSTLRYLPPAPSQFSYGTPTGATNLTYPVTFAGVAANNHTTYDSANLTRTIRYKIGSGNWTYVDNATVAAIDYVTSFDITVPAGQVATIEGWQTYHGMDSTVDTITISNTNAPVALYGSVGGEAKVLGPVYASVNGRTKKLTKIYASVGGVTKKVYEDV